MRTTRWMFMLILAIAGISIAGPVTEAATRPAPYSFDLVVSAGVANCLPDARGSVRISSHGPNQVMDVRVSGLPARDVFPIFVLQLPHGPFGLSSYHGDIQTDEKGNGHARLIGIFSDETFMVAPGVGSAPVLDAADADTNPQTAPIHALHLGLWFDSVADSVAAGCPAAQTPFNGDHTAGPQVLNTTNFADDDGPLGQFAP